MNEEQIRAEFEAWWASEYPAFDLATKTEAPYKTWADFAYVGWQAALDKVFGEPAVEVVSVTGSLNDIIVLKWISDYRPKAGDKLYAPKEKL